MTLMVSLTTGWSFKFDSDRLKFDFIRMKRKPQSEIPLTLISKSWKTRPENFPKFQFSGAWHWPISVNLNQFFSEFQFPGYELDRFPENSSTKISLVPIQFLEKNRGKSQADFWKIHPYLGEFSKNRFVSRSATR